LLVSSAAVHIIFFCRENKETGEVGT
jgi:hypothetical protein